MGGQHASVVSAQPKAEAVAASVRTERRFWRAEWFLFLLFVAPNVILFGIFTYWPMIQNGYLSTVRWDMVSPRKISVGLSNYQYLLTSSEFRTVFVNTIVFTVATVGLSLVLGLLAALLLNQPLRGRNGARAVLFAPTLLSGAAISLVWVYMFDPRFGLVAQVLGLVQPQFTQLADRPRLGDAGRSSSSTSGRTWASPPSSTWRVCNRSRATSTKRPR